MGLLSSVKARAAGQANFNIETVTGTVTKVYTDANGNVTHSDVMVNGQSTALVRVPNVSGYKIQKYLPVKLNYAKGNRQSVQLIGVSGPTASSGIVSSGGGASAGFGAGGGTTTLTPSPGDLSGYGFLLAAPDASLPLAYALIGGANVTLAGGTDTAGNATLIASAGPVVAAAPLPALPSALYPPGTLLDLVDSGGAPQGMFRVSVPGDSWLRRDAASVATGTAPSVPAWMYEKLNVEPGTSGASDLTAFTAAIATVLTSMNGDLVDLNSSGASRTTAWGQKARYTTELTVLTARTIQVDCTADNGARCYLNGVQVGSDFGDTFGGDGRLGFPVTLTLALTAGRNTLQFRFYQDSDGGGSNSGFTCQGVGGTLASLVDQILAPLPAASSGSGGPPSGSAGGDLTGTYPSPTLGASGVAAGTYGDSTHVPSVTFDAKGRATAVSLVAISGATGGSPSGTSPNRYQAHFFLPAPANGQFPEVHILPFTELGGSVSWTPRVAYVYCAAANSAEATVTFQFKVQGVSLLPTPLGLSSGQTFTDTTVFVTSGGAIISGSGSQVVTLQVIGSTSATNFTVGIEFELGAAAMLVAGSG